MIQVSTACWAGGEGYSSRLVVLNPSDIRRLCGTGAGSIVKYNKRRSAQICGEHCPVWKGECGEGGVGCGGCGCDCRDSLDKYERRC